jgi:hypothetical protein
MRQIDEDLFYASNDGDLEKAKHAIENGADVNTTGFLGVVSLLLEKASRHE